ncbi:hypothetical protein F4778DRAFT_348873 [Xylariomycetidae sp. FL2044]|nr:hypothetical protein F4778DRAFT_348873 [Xylariomycetidae sp. FL2044]
MLTTPLLLAAVASAHQIPRIAQRDFIHEIRQDGPEVNTGCQSALSQILPLYSSLPTPPPAILTAGLPTDPCATPSLTGDAAAQYTSYSSEVLSWYTSHSAELQSALAECTQLMDYATGVPVCSTMMGGAGGAMSTGGAGGASATMTGMEASSVAATAESESGSMKTKGGSSSSSEEGESGMMTMTGGHSMTMTMGGGSMATSTDANGSIVANTNAAPRETGFVAAAGVMAAAFVGAVAAL